MQNSNTTAAPNASGSDREGQSSQRQRQQRPRIRHSRTRTGCTRCRAQRRKCKCERFRDRTPWAVLLEIGLTYFANNAGDEQKPACKRCSDAGTTCQYVRHISFHPQNSRPFQEERAINVALESAGGRYQAVKVSL